MHSRLVFGLFALLASAFSTTFACSSDDSAGGAGGGNDAGADAPVTARPVGSPCSCDAECSSDAQYPGLCLHGVCAQKAPGACAESGTEAGCPAGSKCFDVLSAGASVCLPVMVAANCPGGAINRHDVCSPVKGKGCDASCGQGCTLTDPAPGTPGAACTSDTQCSLTDPQCYTGTEPAGWEGGYCLGSTCADSSECNGGACLPVFTSGASGCVQPCGHDIDCRVGYTCSKIKDGTDTYCRAGCDAASPCPSGRVCLDNECIDESVACSTSNPFGYCPDGSWCDKGTCNTQPYQCDGSKDAQEPNDTLATAKPAPKGKTDGLTICAGDSDWFKITVPKGKIVRVGITFQHGAGDLDMLALDDKGYLIGSRLGESYPYGDRAQETNTEFYGFYSEAGGTEYVVKVVGFQAAENVYSLSVDEIDYQDGAVCTDTYSAAECIGQQPGGKGLIPVPFPDTAAAATAPTNNYVWDTYANYRFARRELAMLVRHAISETSKAFPNTNPLGLIDTCQIDGITPGYDVGDPRHPETTHDQGGNMDIAYFQTGQDNRARIVCNDGAQHADGFCTPAAKTSHTVDLPRQAFFMAKLFASPRTRVIGVDQVLAPLIGDAAKVLAALPPTDPQHITAQELAKFSSGMAFGGGWPFHHHHIHLSMQWWGAQTAPVIDAGPISPFIEANTPAHPLSDLFVAWPPVGTSNKPRLRLLPAH